MMLTVLAFVAACSLLLLVFVLLGGRNTRLEARVLGLSTESGPATPPKSVARLARLALPKIASPILPEEGAERTRLKARLIHAGWYSRHAMGIFLGVKMLLMVLPLMIGAIIATTNRLPWRYSALGALVGSGIGMVAPNLWLDYRKRKRQSSLRCSLPDALDITVICLEGGLSLQGAFQRVANALRTAHPMLAAEMNIVQREIQLGRTTGDALRQFADRCDLEEVRSLASVVLQAERLGAGIVKSLRVHADTLRTKRLQRAEELAQMAGTKMVFPTILFIFPAILFVVAAPAIFLIMNLFTQMQE